jgi:ATP-dependent Clp protease protease subunit|nr:MAG TPA: Putative ATP dependent Clp protease [Caudoviricetes sp.]
MKSRFYNFEKINDEKAAIYIYGDIVSEKWWSDTDVDPTTFKDELAELGDVNEIDVHINSFGGEVYAGFAIHNLLKQHKASINVYIDGIAASIASVIAMAGDRIYMPKTALMMIHNCWTWASGDSKELRKTAEDLDKVGEAIKSSYLNKVNITKEELERLLDEESLMTAEECLSKGFIDEIIQDDKEIQNKYTNKTLLKMYNKMNNKTKEQEISDETIDKIANRIIEKTKIKNNKDEKNKDLQENNKNSWESFFYTKK